MARILQIALLVAGPIAIFFAMMQFDRSFGRPGRGYDYVLRLELPPSGSKVDLPPIKGPLDASRPLVVIDAGHGGHDPGAGAGSLKEKVLTLRLAERIRDKLLEGGGIRVALTRSDDRYLLLPERYDIARRLNADLFISIHADSVGNDVARGGSVYSLSSRGSSEAAARIAERENDADTINGVALSDTSDAVSAILVDLSQRETQAQSLDMARLYLREVKGQMRLHYDTPQSAAFIVLKAPDVPSVLIEAGYISNPDDAALLASEAGQATFSAALDRTIRAYFARRAGP